MASLSELKVTISVDHRIRGLFLVGTTFIKMAIKDIFTIPSRKAKSDLNFIIVMKLKENPKTKGIKVAWANLKEDLRTAVQEIGKDNVPNRKL